MVASKVPGFKLWVGLEDSGGTVRDISNDVKTVSAPSNSKFPDVSGGGDTHMSYVIGQLDETVTLEGPFDTAANKAHAVLAGLLGGTTGRKFYFGPAGSASGFPLKFGTVQVASYDVKQDVSDAARWTAQLIATEQTGISWGTFA